MGHNTKVPIRIHVRYHQTIFKFAKCGPRCEGRGQWIIVGLESVPGQWCTFGFFQKSAFSKKIN